MKWKVLIILIQLLFVSYSFGETSRSWKVVQEFKKITGYPHGRPGYVIDHIHPLAYGGLDDVINLQWQTIKKAKAKDKWERKFCPEWSSFSFK